MSYNIHQFEHEGKRYSFVNDELYQTRGSYAYDTEEETKAVEDEEIAKLNSGDWIAVGCIVEEQCPGIEQHNPHASDQRPVHCACCHAKGPWMEIDSLWGIVIDNSNDAMEKFVKEGGI